MQFRGIKKDYLKVLRGRKRPPWAPIQREILTMPGKPGGYLDGTQTGIRLLNVPVYIEGSNFSDLQKVKEDLAAWLITEKEEELIFSDEPDRIYYAMIDGSCDLDELVNYGQGIITFICLDPYKYATNESSTQFVSSGTVNVGGSKTSEPIVKVTVNKDTTFVAIGDGEQINMIGQQAEVTQQPVVREERKFWHEMGTLVGWSDTTTVEEGVNTGTMKTTGYSFFTDNYGTNAGWHGPAKKISIGSSIQDFQVDALIYQGSGSGKIGSVEIALLDASNNIVGKLLMTKRSTNNSANWARLRAGNVSSGYDIINSRGANDSTWANFDGILRMGRVGNTWYAYVAKIDSNGKYHTSLWKQWTDSKNISPSPITQVQVQLWQYGTVPTTQQYVSDLKVYKINSVTDSQVPIIARTGDIIEFDHQSDVIRRNGEIITKEKAFIGEYFSLKPGSNAIVVEPVDSIQETEVRWRNRWL